MIWGLLVVGTRPVGIRQPLPARGWVAHYTPVETAEQGYGAILEGGSEGFEGGIQGRAIGGG